MFKTTVSDNPKVRAEKKGINMIFKKTTSNDEKEAQSKKKTFQTTDQDYFALNVKAKMSRS